MVRNIFALLFLPQLCLPNFLQVFALILIIEELFCNTRDLKNFSNTSKINGSEAFQFKFGASTEEMVLLEQQAFVKDGTRSGKVNWKKITEICGEF